MELGIIVVCLAVIAGCVGPTSPSDDRFLRRPGTPPPSSPPSGSAFVRGVVTDSIQHNPLGGAVIHWGRFSDCEDGGGLATDANGSYTMSVDPRGSVLGEVVSLDICATRDGYRDHVEVVLLTLDSSAVTVNFVLTPTDANRTRAGH